MPNRDMDEEQAAIGDALRDEWKHERPPWSPEVINLIEACNRLMGTGCEYREIQLQRPCKAILAYARTRGERKDFAATATSTEFTTWEWDHERVHIVVYERRDWR